MTLPHAAPDGVERDLAVGYEEMDGEHRVQVGLLQALRDAVLQDRPAADVDEILETLLEYSKVHFTSEQLLMRLHAYPGYQAHLAEHDDAVEKVEHLREAVRAGRTALTIEVLDGITHWLVEHIRRTDRALGFFVNRLDPGRE
ncbi:MAG: hemerythrin family protein [Rhodospirillales bacterium]|nr:hemerythrin family protein [Rhodospirillales bacterium]